MARSILGLGITGDLQDVCEALGKSAAWCQGKRRALLPEEVEMCRAMAAVAGAPHLKVR